MKSLFFTYGFTDFDHGLLIQQHNHNMPRVGWRKRRPKATVFHGVSRKGSAALWAAAFSPKGLPWFDVMLAVMVFWWRSPVKIGGFFFL